jgi:cytochrome c oxidase subunit 3
VHGLHLLGGLAVWGKTSVKLLRNHNVNQLHLSIELLTIYWHFLLAVWLIMFVMMLLT